MTIQGIQETKAVDMAISRACYSIVQEVIVVHCFAVAIDSWS
jgi:hypothetical protein